MGYPLDKSGTIGRHFVQGSLDTFGTIWRRGREGEERGKPRRYKLPSSRFLPSSSATPCAATPVPRKAATKIIPNLSKDPWTNWGLFLWQLSEAQASLHKEWRRRKVGIVTMAACTDGASPFPPPLYPSSKSSQKCPRILGQNASQSSPICPKGTPLSELCVSLFLAHVQGANS